MKVFFLFIAIAIGVSSCGSTKNAEPKGLSAADYPYIEKFHEGVRFKAKGQLREAIQSFEFCLIQKPNDDAVAFALAQCHLMLDQKSKAADYTEIASKIDPKNIWYTQELAYMYFEQGKLQESANCFEKMVAKEPKNADWMYGYAEVLKRLGKKQEAINAFDKMEGQLGLIPDISLQKFELYRSLKQDEKAVNELTKARKLYPDEPSIIGTLVDYYFEKRDVQKAKDMLTELVRTNPNNGRANLALADLLVRESNKKAAYPYFKAGFLGEGVDIDTKMNVLLGFYEQQITIDQEVIELAEIMIEKHPTDAKSHSILGDLLLKNNEQEKAIASFKKALALDPDKFAIWNQILIIEYQQKQFADLYKDARACSALFPTISNVQLLYTIACVQTNRYTEAIEAADIGKEVVVNDKLTESEFYAQKAEALFWLNQLKLSYENFEQALVLDPTNHLTKNNYALLIALGNGSLEKASMLIDGVMAQYPNQPAFMDTKAVVLFQQKKYDDSARLLEQALSMEPNNRNVMEHLGDAYSKINQPEKAVDNWKKAKSMGATNKILDKKIQTKSYYAPVF